jgi:hypothetical protein
VGVMTAAVHLVTPSTPHPGAPTVTPHHRPIPLPSLPRLITASVILGLPSAVAIWGSAAGLTAIATDDNVAAPWTLPFCLDVLALGVVIVAMLFPHVAHRVTWKATPWLCYFGSGILQVSAAFPLGPRAWATHAAALVAAAVGSHFILHLWAGRAALPLAVPEPVEVADHERPTVVALAKPVRTTRPAPARPAKPDAPEPDPEVVAKVAKALAEMGVDAHETTRDPVLAHLREKDGSAPHATKVGAALRHLKEQS